VWSYLSGAASAAQTFQLDGLSVTDLLAGPAPQPAPKAQTQTYGAAPIGSTSYPVPAGAYFVSPSGSDSNPGTLAAPFRTAQRAVNVVPSGSTVVLRAGTYHEYVNVPYAKTVTLQNYPGEAVWFDGSQPVTGFVPDSTSGGYLLNNWTYQFDHTDPTAGNTDPAWQMVQSSYPMAAWPDMVFEDGRSLTQVQSLSQLAAGTFYVDYTNSKLYLGDNPSGHLVEATTVADALYINHGDGSTVRGIGFERYATPINDMGMVKGYANNVTFENDVFTRGATTGLAINGAGIVVRNCSLTGNGQLGMQGTTSDNLTLTGSDISGNNSEHFNGAPVAGGVKLTSSRNDVVSTNRFSNNLATGLWFDESSWAPTISNNLVMGNARHGIDFEISAGALIAGNVVANNASNGINIADSNNVRIWNNTLATNGRDLMLADGPRQSTSSGTLPTGTPGLDPRYGYDPNITWVTTGIEVRNNLLSDIAQNGFARDPLGIDDYTKTKTYAQMVTALDNDGYYRPTGSYDPWIAQLADYPTYSNPLVPSTFAALQADAVEAHGVGVDTGTTNPFFVNAAGGDYTLQPGSIAVGKGAPLPAAVASAIGATAGVAVNMGAL
jgi:parallel beta-helix repeat protein